MPFVSSLRRNYDIETQQNNDFEVTGSDSVYTAGGYQIHTFTTVGDAELFVKNLTSPTNAIHLSTGSQLTVESLIVGGGGAGGAIGGGGGGGGVVYSNTMNLSTGSVPLTGGAGGGSCSRPSGQGTVGTGNQPGQPLPQGGSGVGFPGGLGGAGVATSGA